MRVAAEYGADGAVLDALAHAENDLLGSEFLAHDELIEQLLAGFRDSFLDRLAKTLKSVAHVGKRGLGHVALAVVFISLVIKQVDVGVRLTVHDVGNHNGADRGTKGRFERLEYAVEARVLVAQTVDEEYLCQACLRRRLNSLFGTDVDAVLARNNDQSGIRRAHTLGYAAREVKETGGVDEINLCVLPLYGSNGGHNGRLSLNLFAVKIEHGVAVGNLAQSVADLRHVEDGLRYRGLAAAAVTRKRDVQNLFCVVLFQK